MKARGIAQSALIGALYALLTFASLPVGPAVQLRLSEALCILPVFTPYAVPGLFVGCILGNVLLGAAAYDVLFGSLATLLAALCTRYIALRGYPRGLFPLPAVVINAFVVGALMVLVYAVPGSYWACTGYVAVGQVLACYGLGIPLMLVLEKYKAHIFR